jgi:hypothetical protein
MENGMHGKLGGTEISEACNVPGSPTQPAFVAPKDRGTNGIKYGVPLIPRAACGRKTGAVGYYGESNLNS